MDGKNVSVYNFFYLLLSTYTSVVQKLQAALQTRTSKIFGQESCSVHTNPLVGSVMTVKTLLTER